MRAMEKLAVMVHWYTQLRAEQLVWHVGRDCRAHDPGAVSASMCPHLEVLIRREVYVRPREHMSLLVDAALSPIDRIGCMSTHLGVSGRSVTEVFWNMFQGKLFIR